MNAQTREIVMAVMLTSTTSKAEALDINQRLDHMARAGAQSEEDIRLCYVTVSTPYMKMGRT